MKRFLSLSLLLTFAVACNPAPVPSQVTDQTVNLGQQVSGQARQEFTGTWSVTELPGWLSVSNMAGRGPVDFKVTATRAVATPQTADQPQLRGVIKVGWQAGQSSGVALWTVVADQYTLTGRMVDTATITSADIRRVPLKDAAADQASSVSQSRGIIVQYRSAGVRDALLGRRTPLDAQQVGNAQEIAPAAVRQSEQRLTALGAHPRQRRALTDRAVVLEIPATAAALAALRTDPEVVSAVPNRLLYAQGLANPVTPSDQYAPLQWAFRLLGYPAVWRDMEAGTYTRPVTVAVLDSGVRFDHPDLSAHVLGAARGALDFVDGDHDPTDPGSPDAYGNRESHGTHVTGIIAANWGVNNVSTCAGCSTTGVVGASYLAPVSVLPVRVLGPDGVDVATLTTAIQYAAGLPVSLTHPDGTSETITNPTPANVINLSLGGPGLSTQEAAPMCDAIAQARGRGVLTVAAAGNRGSTEAYHPAACEAAVAVGSVTLSGASAPQAAYYSNHYPKVELTAPGGAGLTGSTFNGNTLNGNPYPDEIMSTGWDYASGTPSYVSMSGTSQASPQVAALAALLLSKGLTNGAEDTLTRLRATATDLGSPGRDEFFGVGMINAAAALSAPPITDTLGLRLQDSQGNSYQPALDALGNFTAYLADGTYRVIGGRDRNGNGVYGETNEPAVQRSVTLDSGTPSVNLGDLAPQ